MKLCSNVSIVVSIAEVHLGGGSGGVMTSAGACKAFEAFFRGENIGDSIFIDLHTVFLFLKNGVVSYFISALYLDL